ncbi:MAG: histidine kinase [Chloroflexota bacterium]
MLRGRGLRLTIGVLGTIWALVAEGLSFQSGQTPSAGLLNLAIGLTYLYGGLAIWDHEPTNRTGGLMTAVGLAWFISPFAHSDIPIVNQVGLALEDTATVLILALVLAYPSGRLTTAVDRTAVAILAIGATTLNLLFSTTLFNIDPGPTGLYGGVILATIATVVIVRRWLIAPRRERRELLPVLVAGLVFLAILVINLARRISDVPEDVGTVLIAARDLAPAAIPVALLIGFYRQSERRLRAIVDAIPDRMVRFDRDGAFVPGTLEAVEVGGGAGHLPVGRQLHEAMFAVAGRDAVAAGTDALDSGRLQAFDFVLELAGGRRELEARVAPSGPNEVTAIIRDFTAVRAVEAEVRRSRARILEATDQERQRLERDLHDGAQQRLVSVSLALRRLRGRLAADSRSDVEAVAAADEAARELKVAIQELRELARGIHPAILTEAGLGAAITALADRSAVPTTVRSVPDRRLSPAVEATSYFVVSEALANVAKHAGATSVSIAAVSSPTRLRIEVGDDGVGGANAANGTGIRGLQDRLAAIGGTLSTESPAGQGTLLVAEIPIL